MRARAALVVLCVACDRRGAVQATGDSTRASVQRPSSLVPTASVVREEKIIRVGSASERWLLVWRAAPAPACMPRDEGWSSCACHGFAFGEMGQLDLLRKIPGHPDEALPLTPLFDDGENPATQRMLHGAVLQRWPVLEADYAHMDDTSRAFEESVRSRAAASVM